MSSKLWLCLLCVFCKVLCLPSSSSKANESSAPNNTVPASGTGPLHLTMPIGRSIQTTQGRPLEPISNATTVKTEAHFCNAIIYGHPPLSSCRLAWQRIPDTSRVLTFGNRPPRPEIEVTVPYRFISRKIAFPLKE